MCAVSAMHDYFRTQVPVDAWTPNLFGQYQEIIHRLESLDVAFKQPDCVEADKEAWMREVRERLAALEAK